MNATVIGENDPVDEVQGFLFGKLKYVQLCATYFPPDITAWFEWNMVYSQLTLCVFVCVFLNPELFTQSWRNSWRNCANIWSKVQTRWRHLKSGRCKASLLNIRAYVFPQQRLLQLQRLDRIWHMPVLLAPIFCFSVVSWIFLLSWSVHTTAAEAH